jgi:hypothetical protein
MVIVGDAEFHANSSEWYSHGHNNDPAYDNVILHIIINDDAKGDPPCEVLQMQEAELHSALRIINETEKEDPDIFSIEELQHYALLRLLRKTSYSQKLIRQNGLEKAFIEICDEYLNKYFSRRRRPVYDADKLSGLIHELPSSRLFTFLTDIANGSHVEIPDMMMQLVKQKIITEGSHLRREILLNCILPIALCLANETARINLFLWFWSTPALHTYGLLKRKFKDFPQNFLWQQQGMLEYLKEHGRRGNVVSEVIKEYGFGEVLSFYRQGRVPFASYPEDSL